MIVMSKMNTQIERKSHPLGKIINGTIIDLPSPINISYLWNFGSSLGLMLGIQMVTGLILASHYSSDVESAFESVNRIMLEVGWGWFFRILHLNGASFFFLFLFLHLFRGMYYSSFRKSEVWNLGVIIMVLSMATAFLGYVLPWGQMSFWGATVITNLISAIPAVGGLVVQWVWGGFSVGGPTLSRFFMLHFLLPFTILGAVILHLFFLHLSGSSNPLGSKSSINVIPFHWYFSVKDVMFFGVLIMVLLYFVFFLPFSLGDPENFILANPLVTPTHIVPEWYFLFAYAILRSIPHKFLGVVALGASIVVFFAPPILAFLTKPTNNGGYAYSSMSVGNQIYFWSFLGVGTLLTWIGGEVVEAPFILIGQGLIPLYFILILLIFFSSGERTRF